MLLGEKGKSQFAIYWQKIMYEALDGTTAFCVSPGRSQLDKHISLKALFPGNLWEGFERYYRRQMRR